MLHCLAYIIHVLGFNNEYDQRKSDKEDIPHLFLASGIWNADGMVPARKSTTVLSKHRVDFTKVQIHYPDPKTEPIPPPSNPFIKSDWYATNNFIQTYIRCTITNLYYL